MNKKGEVVFLSIILLSFIIAGVLYYEHQIDNKYYVGDTLSKNVYYIKSNSTDCQLDKIGIEKQNMILFSSLEEANKNGYILNSTCP